MKKRDLNIPSLVFFICGIYLLLNSKVVLTGAAIGVPNAPSILSSTFAVILIIVSIIMFAENLETKTRAGPGLLPRKEEAKAVTQNEVQAQTTIQRCPTLVDANVVLNLFPAKYVQKSELDKLKSSRASLRRTIKRYSDDLNPVYIPKKVLGEIKISKGDESEQQSRTSFKNFLGEPEHIRTLEANSEYIGPREGGKGRPYKQVCESIASRILKKTPKYIAHQYLEEINKNERNGLSEISKLIKAGNWLDEDKFGLLKKDIQEYTDKEMRKFSKSLNLDKKYKTDEGKKIQEANQRVFNSLRDAIVSSLHIAVSDYRHSGNKGEVLKRYDISPADTQLFANALYLHYKHHVPDSSDVVHIVSEDEHLKQAAMIYSLKFPKHKGKIQVLDKLE